MTRPQWRFLVICLYILVENVVIIYFLFKIRSILEYSDRRHILDRKFGISVISARFDSDPFLGSWICLGQNWNFCSNLHPYILYDYVQYILVTRMHYLLITPFFFCTGSSRLSQESKNKLLDAD